ncbi:hypothetical protein niasHT_032349 [Heterodera trifolii]|uniref:diacylglycerol cholinephosphotransferase n=1 Tax=Heterodera trifolii TaxID=157864 RepID=A0ABD2HR78_9BILA
MARNRSGGGAVKNQRDKQRKEQQQQHGASSAVTAQNNALLLPATDQQQHNNDGVEQQQGVVGQDQPNNFKNDTSSNDNNNANSFSESLPPAAAKLASAASLLRNHRQRQQRRSTTPRETKGPPKGGGGPKSNVLKRARLHLFEFVNWYIENDCQLNTAQIVRLGAHVYSSTDSSILDHLFMSRFWNWLVHFYPIWLAPNLITLIGLIINLITVLVLSNFCYSAKEIHFLQISPFLAPSWAYSLAALGLFLYQTLDATDGKQARRTHSSSPLGELFDHGCDSMTQVFVTLNICYAMQLGSYRHLVLITMMVSLGLFYTAHWSTYCTGQLRFSKFDVTEAQMMVISILVATSLFGPGIWNIELFGLQFQLKIIFMSVCLLGSVWHFFSYLKVILNDGVGKNGSTVAGTSVIYPLFPLLAVCVPFLMIYYKTNSGVYDQNITVFCLCFGAVAAKATNRLIIAHMSKSELELWDWVYLSPFVMILNQYYDYYFDEYTLLLASTVYAYASLITFCTFICRQFCDFLGISCFRIDVQHQRHRRNLSSENGSIKKLLLNRAE